MSPTQSRSTDTPDGLPSQGVRTLITLLLFMHLFAIFAAVAGNFGARSGLRQNLRSVMRPYLRMLAMDTGYDYALIYNTSDDWDHTCEIVLNPPADLDEALTSGKKSADFDTISMMPEDAWPGLRRRRYFSLAYSLSVFENEDREEAALVTALANGMLNKHSIEDGTHRFRCLAQQPQSMVPLDEIEPEIRDPNHPRWFERVYEASLLRDEGRWSPYKMGGRGEMTQARSDLQRSE